MVFAVQSYGNYSKSAVSENENFLGVGWGGMFFGGIFFYLGRGR